MADRRESAVVAASTARDVRRKRKRDVSDSFDETAAKFDAYASAAEARLRSCRRVQNY